MLKNIKNIRPMLKSDCSFRDALDKIDQTLCSTQMMGMTTSTFCVSWNVSFYGIHKHLITARRWMEMLNVSKAMAENFPTPTSLLLFCQKRGEQINENHFNFYMDGDDLEADYWISAQTIPGHFEFKVHSIAKGGPDGS